MNRVLKSVNFPPDRRMEIVQGDLIQEPVEAIVNAANAHLAHGGGVAGLISARGGPKVDEESRAWVRQHGPVSHDSPAYTTAGNLPFRYILHAVGPVWGEGNEEEKLGAAVRGCLACADELGLASIALPAISTGIFGFPRERAARVIFQAIDGYFSTQPGSALKLVRVVLYDPETAQIFVREHEKSGQG